MSLFGENGQTRVSFDSPNHEECDALCPVPINQLQRTQWSKNRIKAQKTENRS